MYRFTKKSICELCEEYIAGAKCDNEAECKIIAVLKENQKLKDENRSLKKQISELKNKMSYMVNPFAIGDRNGEMGW